MNDTLSHQEYLSYTLHPSHQHSQHQQMMHQYGAVQQQYGAMAQTSDLLQQAASGLLATEAPDGVLLTLPTAAQHLLPPQYGDLSHVLVSTQNTSILSPPNSTEQNSRSNSTNIESSGQLSGGSSHSSSSSSSSKKKRMFEIFDYFSIFLLSLLSRLC